MKRRFTKHEHLGAGLMLSTVDRDMHLLANAIGDAYGSVEFTKAMSVIRALSKLKSALDSRVCSEHPLDVADIDGVPITRVYYGWNRTDHVGRTSKPEREQLKEAAQVALAALSKADPA